MECTTTDGQSAIDDEWAIRKRIHFSLNNFLVVKQSIARCSVNLWYTTQGIRILNTGTIFMGFQNLRFFQRIEYGRSDKSIPFIRSQLMQFSKERLDRAIQSFDH